MKTLPAFTGDGSIKTALAKAKPLHLPFNVIIDEAMARVEQDELEQLFENNAAAELYGVPVRSIIEALDNPKPDFSEINELVRYCHNKSTIAGHWNTHDEKTPNLTCEGAVLCVTRELIGAVHSTEPEIHLGEALSYILDLAGYLGCNLAQGFTEALNNQSE